MSYYNFWLMYQIFFIWYLDIAISFWFIYRSIIQREKRWGCLKGLKRGGGKFSRTPGEINRLVECFIVTGNIPWEINMFKNKVGAVSWFCQNVCVFFFLRIIGLEKLKIGVYWLWVSSLPLTAELKWSRIATSPQSIW